MTIRVRNDMPSLRCVRLVRELERSFREPCERGRFRLVHYSIQSNHVHMIVEAASSLDLAAGMKSIGARLARAVNRVLRRRGPVLADRYHAHVLRTPRDLLRAAWWLCDLGARPSRLVHAGVEGAPYNLLLGRRMKPALNRAAPAACWTSMRTPEFRVLDTNR